MKIEKLFAGMNDNERVYISNPHIHDELIYTVKRAKEVLSNLTEEQLNRTTVRKLGDE